MFPTSKERVTSQALGVGAFLLTLGVVAISGLGPRMPATEKLLPHGFCYLWDPALLRLHVAADALIGAAYIAIPITLVSFIRRRTDLPFNWMFLLFGLFIVACGATHLMEIWTLWSPNYWLSGGVKAITAAASVPTAILLYMLVPQALALPSTRQLREAKEAAEREAVERQRAELALREAHALLEQRVQDRTAELQRANQQLERQRRELERADRQKTDFLAILSHELRNPVHAIHVGAEYLKLKEEPDTQEAAQTIGRQVDQLSQLLDDLLSVARNEYQPDKLQRQSLDVREIVAKSAETMAGVVAGRDQRMDVDVPSAPVAVEADARRLSQALVNLLHNASKYSDPGSAIGLTLKSEAGHAVLRVRDDGIGFDEDEATRVFELFVRGERAKRRVATGLGIGLHVARQIVEAHGGTISAASDGPGRGTTFEIRLPLAESR